MLPLGFALRRRVERASRRGDTAAARRQAEMPFSPMTLQVLLCIAGVACCVAMSMPQVHIVAYCGDLGYGVARGAEMLSLMLGFRHRQPHRLRLHRRPHRRRAHAAARLGAARNRAVPLSVVRRLFSLYVISALFGLFQGGIVPSYAIIVREYFSPREAGTRIGLVLMATLLGMALGGWMSGAIFDLRRFLSGGVPQRARLEPGERVDHDLAAAALAPRAGLRPGGVNSHNARHHTPATAS